MFVNPCVSLTRFVTDKEYPGSLAHHQALPMLSTSQTPGYSITVTHCKSIAKLLNPDPEKASPDSSSALSTYLPSVTGIDHCSLSLANLSWYRLALAKTYPFTLDKV